MSGPLTDLVEIARVNPRLESTAPSPELVDTIAALASLAKRVHEFCPAAFAGHVSRRGWAMLTDELIAAARMCAAQIAPADVIEG